MNLIGLFASFVSAGVGGASGASDVPGAMSVLALELPRAVTPTIAGLAVGAIVGVIGFVAVLMLVGRGQRRSRRAHMRADQVVFIPPYGTMPRETPLPPAAFAVPPSSSRMPVGAAYQRAPLAARPRAHGRGHMLPFVPSTSLSARAFAKMGYEVDAEDERDAPDAEPFVSIEIDMLDEDDLIESNTPAPPAPACAAVLISPVVVLTSTTPVGGIRSAQMSAPHPLGVIKSTSTSMKAAPIADLSFDDSPTEIGETYFDETPQPRRRTDPPKIRAISPKGPRFPDATPMLPRVTPPPARAARFP